MCNMYMSTCKDMYCYSDMESNVVMLSCYYSEYIDPNANSMVNLSANAFEEAQKDIENPSRYSFSLAQVHASCSLISIYYK